MEAIAEPDIKELDTKPETEPKTYYGFGYPGDKNNEPFIVISKKKAKPSGIEKMHLLWVIGGVTTDEELSVQNEAHPSVGDVCMTHEGEVIEIVSVDYY